MTLTNTKHTVCRSCEGVLNDEVLLDLGNQRINDFPEAGVDLSTLPRCPIEIVWCPRCRLAQQRYTAPAELLYRRHYWYRSGTTQTMRDALEDVARAAELMVDLQPSDIVLDIGSNDGTLLRSYSKPCVKVGVDPASNIQEEGSRGVDVFISDFWSEGVYRNAIQSFGRDQEENIEGP